MGGLSEERFTEGSIGGRKGLEKRPTTGSKGKK